jgi:peroxiredoxin
LVYTGTFLEETHGRSVQFSRTYGLETRLFILDTSPTATEVALLTLIKERSKASPGVKPAQPNSARLEVVRVNPRGKLILDSTAMPALPLDGPATIEHGALVEVPGTHVKAGRKWEVAEAGRPACRWQVIGAEPVNGTPCVNLVGEQKSDDWDQPRADRTAWRRRETVWMLPGLGVAYRVERVLEQREPARRDPGHKMVTLYTLENQVVYPGQLFEDRRDEIHEVYHLAQSVQPLLREPEKAGPRAFEPFLARIAAHCEHRPATPYRQAMDQLKRRIEAAQRGEATPGPAEEAAPVAPVIALGRPAPDFVVPDLVTHESAHLRRFLGRPTLLVFYSPTSKQARSILEFAQSLVGNSDRPAVTVLGLAVSDDTEGILKQRRELKLTYPILSGQGLHLTYAIEATPKFVVLDAGGVVRDAIVGWGREIPELLKQELQRRR